MEVGLSDALGKAIKITVHTLTIKIAIAPIFFSTRKETINMNSARAHRIRISNNPTPTPNTTLVMPLKKGNSNVHPSTCYLFLILDTRFSVGYSHRNGKSCGIM